MYRQREGVKIVLNGNDQVLAAVEFIGHERGQQVSTHVEVPEGFARSGINGEEIAGIVSGKKQMTGGGQNSRDRSAITEFMIPDNFAGLVVERAQSRVCP